MNRFKCSILVASTLALAAPLAGCGSALPDINNFDPTELVNLDFLSRKKPLPGERKPLFTGGVPGVARGVPPDLVKGNQPPPGAEVAPEAAVQAAAVAEEPKVEPKPEPKAKPKPKPKPKVAARAAPVAPVAPQSTPPQSTPTQVTVRGSNSPWPDPPQQPQPQPQRPAATQWPTPPGVQNSAPGAVQWPDPPAPR